MVDDPKPGQAAEIKPEDVANLRPLEAPRLYASSFQLQGSGNDFNLILQRGSPTQNPDGSIHPAISKLETVAVLTMSPASVKDLHLLLGTQIEHHQQQYGAIETPFTKRRAAQQED
jgi:hypothetical protein